MSNRLPPPLFFHRLNRYPSGFKNFTVYRYGDQVLTVFHCWIREHPFRPKSGRRRPMSDQERGDPNVMDPWEAVRLAIDAIRNDPRRTPYGHHQWDRERAIRALEALTDE